MLEQLKEYQDQGYQFIIQSDRRDQYGVICSVLSPEEVVHWDDFTIMRYNEKELVNIRVVQLKQIHETIVVFNYSKYPESCRMAKGCVESVTTRYDYLPRPHHPPRQIENEIPSLILVDET